MLGRGFVFLGREVHGGARFSADHVFVARPGAEVRGAADFGAKRTVGIGGRIFGFLPADGAFHFHDGSQKDGPHLRARSVCCFLGSMSSARAEPEREGNIPLEGVKLVVFVGTRETDPQHVFVGAHFGDYLCVARKFDARKKVAPTVDRVLHGTRLRLERLHDAVGADLVDHHLNGVADRLERGDPALQFLVARRKGHGEPVMQDGKVEFAGAARKRLARADELQPFVFADALAGLADDARDVVNEVREVLMTGRAGFRLLTTSFESLDELVAKVRTGGGVRQVKERADRAVVRHGRILGGEPVEAVKERLQTQIGPNLFVAGEFVADDVGIRHETLLLRPALAMRSRE